MRRFVYITYGIMAQLLLSAMDQPIWLQWTIGIALMLVVRSLMVHLEMHAMSEGARLARRFSWDPGLDALDPLRADGASSPRDQSRRAT